MRSSQAYGAARRFLPPSTRARLNSRRASWRTNSPRSSSAWVTTRAVSPPSLIPHTPFRACSTDHRPLAVEAAPTLSTARSSLRSAVSSSHDRSNSSGGVSRANVETLIEWARQSFPVLSRCPEGWGAIRTMFRQSCGALRSCVSARCILSLV